MPTYRIRPWYSSLTGRLWWSVQRKYWIFWFDYNGAGLIPNKEDAEKFIRDLKESDSQSL